MSRGLLVLIPVLLLAGFNCQLPAPDDQLPQLEERNISSVIWNWFRTTPSSTLPPIRFDVPESCAVRPPNSSACSWYCHCLTSKYRCSERFTHFAVRQGGDFCRYLTDRCSGFSGPVQEWTDNARACLVSNLEPRVNSSVKDCQEMKQTITDVLRECLLSSIQDLSVCNKSPKDLLDVSWLIKRSIAGRSGLPESFVDALTCDDFSFQSSVTSAYNLTIRIYKIHSAEPGGNGDDGDEGQVSDYQSVYKVIDTMAKQLDWRSYPMEWQTYKMRKLGEDRISVILLIGENKDSFRRNVSSVLTMEDAIESMSVAIRDGNFKIQIPERWIWYFVGETIETCPELVDGLCRGSEKVVEFTNRSDCDPDYGPGSESYVCHLDPEYTSSQRSRCISKEQAIQRFAGRWRCPENYCRVTCMFEVNERTNGEVFPSCACNSSFPVLMMKSGLSRSKDLCVNPNKVALTDCLWYHECWESRLRCDVDAKIEQSVNFCTESSEIRSSFSDAAQSWIGAVQECLQETLASFVGGSIPQWTSCPGIQRLADEAHRKCYIDIFKNISTFHVDVRDWLRIFVVTKSLLGDKFHPDLSNSMSAVQDQLVKEQFSNNPAVGVYQFTLHTYDRYLGRPGGMKILNETIYSVVQSISEQLGWKSHHMEWYIHKFHSDELETRVMLLLVDAKMLSKTNITSMTYGIQNAVDDLAAAVENGRIQVSVAGRVGLTYVIASLKTCSSSVDGNCVTSVVLAMQPSNISLDVSNSERFIKPRNYFAAAAAQSNTKQPASQDEDTDRHKMIAVYVIVAVVAAVLMALVIVCIIRRIGCRKRRLASTKYNSLPHGVEQRERISSQE